MPHRLFTICLLLLTLQGGVAGCKKAPPAAATELVREPGEPNLVRTFSSADQARLKSDFRSLAEGKEATQKPVVAPNGRWSDVYAAVLYACDDVEAAVVWKHEYDWGWEFRLRTVEDWPGTLTIRRATTGADEPTHRIYEASCSIGTFGDRTTRSQALLDAFDKQLLAFGRKPRLPSSDDAPPNGP